MNAQEMIYKIGTWVLGGLLIFVVSSGVSNLEKLSSSVNELNLKIGIMVERTDGMQKKIDDHEDRLKYVERTKKP